MISPAIDPQGSVPKPLGDRMKDVTLGDLTRPYPISADDIAAFRRRGHVLIRELATAEELTTSYRAIAQGVERLSSAQAPLAERDTYAKAFLQVNLWRHDADISAYVHAPRFAGVAAALLGVERVRIYHDQALFKEPGGGITPWHQDAMYWPLDGSQCVTMWMPLCDITPDMGALTFADGSHLAGPLSDIHISDASQAHFDNLLADGAYPLSSPLPMSAGDATFHSGWTVHKASGNTSDRLRPVMTVIWFADGLRVQEPANTAQANDLQQWLPGLAPGELAATDVNRVVT